MKTITIRDLRHRWPEAERSLQAESEILVTRDGKPIAKLVRVVPKAPKRKRWNPNEHFRWIRKVYGKKSFPTSDEQLATARTDRKLF
jgi:antitoxin (DNA-binding transcriptional repressor) of toxin-antitoxin stability system